MKFRIQLIGFLLVMILRSNVGNAEPLFGWGLGGGLNVGRHSLQNQTNSDGQVYSQRGLSINGEIRPSFGLPSILNPISYISPLGNILGQFVGGGQSQRGSQQHQQPSSIAKPPLTNPKDAANDAKETAKNTVNDAKDTAKDTVNDAKETAEKEVNDTDQKRRRRSLLIYPARTSPQTNNLDNPKVNTLELKKNKPRKTRAIPANILQEATNVLTDNAENALKGVLFRQYDPSKVWRGKRSTSEKESHEVHNKLIFEVIRELIFHLLEIVDAIIFETPITDPSQLEVKETAYDEIY